jgi:hypothetical protein
MAVVLNLGLTQKRARADTESRNKATHHELVPFGMRRGYLNYKPNMKDNAPERNGPFTANAVCQRTGH